MTTSENPPNEFENLFYELCDDLAINHARNSIIYGQDETESKLDAILENRLKERSSTSSRNIVILGSGASYDAYADIFPLGQKSVELIEKKLGFGNIVPKNNTKRTLLEEALYKKYVSLRNKLHLDPTNDDTTFETRLAMLSYFLKNDSVRDEIVQLFDYATFPSYFYEVIAHLLKNRFIEGVINFNFDELLDQALTEEMGDGHLNKIISDGDCMPYEDMLTQGKLREPFYIKPHGTASYKSSMRFTKEHYLDVPIEIEHLMEEIFVGNSLADSGGTEGNMGGSSADSGGAEENRGGSSADSGGTEENTTNAKIFERLNLIIFGFAMESIEFNAVLKKAINKIESSGDRKVGIYFFSVRQKTGEKNWERRIVTKEDSIEAEEEKLDAIFKGTKVKPKVISIRKLINYDEKSTTPYLDRVADKLLSGLAAGFEDDYKPSSTIRHSLLSKVFSIEKLDPEEKAKIENVITNYKSGANSEQFEKIRKELYFNTKEYYLDRVIFEIVLVVLKNKGYIQPKESLKGINRVGHYYHLYYKSHGVSTSKAKSIHTILHNMGLSSDEKSIAGDLYTFPKGTYFAKHNFYESESVCLQPWIDRINALKCDDRIDRFCEKTRDSICKVLTNIKAEKSFKELFRRDSLTLYPNYKDYQLNAFGHIDPINIIPTTTALKYRFLSHFLNGDWKVLLLTSDRGMGFINALQKAAAASLKGKTVYLILADIYPSIVEDFNDKIEQLKRKTKLDVIVLSLPFYDHNSHMKLFFKNGKDNSSEPSNAMYYYKRGFSNNINAIHLRPKGNRKNILLLVDKFLSYYCKAIHFKADGDSVLHFTNMKSVIDRLEDIVNDSTNIKLLLSLRKSLRKLIEKKGSGPQDK